MKFKHLIWLLAVFSISIWGCNQSSPPEEDAAEGDVDQDGIPDIPDLHPFTGDSSKSAGEAPQNNIEPKDHKSSDNEANEVDFGQMRE
jgi:hypothetical protein